MPSNDVSDKLLWTAVIATAVFAYFYIPSVLHHVRELAVVPETNTEKPHPQLQKDAEDAIKLSSLGDLALGHSHNLSTSAMKLMFSRFLKSGAKKDLLRDIASKSWDRRDKALNGLAAMLKSPALREIDVHQHFIDRDTFQALVIGLINVLPEHKKIAARSKNDSKHLPYPVSPVRPPLRLAHERMLLGHLNRLLQEPQKTQGAGNVELAIEVGVITKWLAHYPFPCALPQNSHLNYKKSDVCKLLEWKAWGSDDMPMALLFSLLTKQQIGLKQLTEVGLRSASYTERMKDSGEALLARHSRPQRSSTWPGTHDIDDDNDVRMTNGEDTAGHIAWRPFNVQSTESAIPRPGSTDRSPEEESLRRRHREAVVVAEAGAPLRPENILQRQPTETDQTWENIVQEQQDALLRHRSVHGTTRNSVAHQIARERIDGLEHDTLRIGPATVDITSPVEQMDWGLRPEQWAQVDAAANHLLELAWETVDAPAPVMERVWDLVAMVRARNVEEGMSTADERPSVVVDRWLEQIRSLSDSLEPDLLLSPELPSAELP